jgi:hypothetical protein
MVQGTLPFPSAEPWAGRGSGGPCVICGVPIPASDVEYQVTRSREVSERDTERLLPVHLPCYSIWRQEAYAARRSLER